MNATAKRRDGATVMILMALLATLGARPLDPLAYVTNEREGTLSIINTRTHAVESTVGLEARARGVALAPDGSRVYVALSHFSGTRRGRECIAAIEPRTGRTLASISAGTDPEAFAVSHDGRRLFIANEDAGTASVTDARRNRVVATHVVGTEPEGVTLSPDGRLVCVTAETSNTVTVIDTRTNRVRGSFLVGARPRSLAFMPGGDIAYVACENAAAVSVVSVKGMREIASIPIGGETVRPMGVAIDRAGTRVYVSTGRGNGVAVIDPRTNTVTRTIPVGERAWGLALTPDGAQLFVANSLSNTVSVIDTKSERVVATIPVGDGPWGVAIGR